MSTSFAGRLREAIAEKGCSRADLARAIGMTRATVTGWANGRIADPKGEGVSRAAHYLDVSPLWLASGRGAKRPDERSNPLVGNPPHNVGVGPSSWALDRAREIEGVEFTKDAILVAKAFMELPRNERDKFKRQIETKALEYTSAVPDEHLKRREALAPAATKATKRRKRGTATR